MALSPSEIRDWSIYQITNPSGNIYIGKTYNIKGRMSNYRYLSGRSNSQPILFNSLKKYGFDNHIVETLDTFKSDQEYANGKEMFWIRSFMSNISKWRDGNGMNLTDGGEGCVGMTLSEERKRQVGDINRGKPMSEETKQKLREYRKNNPHLRPMLGKKHTQSAKDSMSRNKKGKPSPLRGYKHSEETRLKNSISHIGIPNKSKGKPMWSEEDKKRIGESKIGNTYNRGRRYSDDVKNRMALAQKKYSTTVYQYTLDGILVKEYISIKEAGRQSGVSRTNIKKILNGTIKNPKLFIFKYN